MFVTSAQDHEETVFNYNHLYYFYTVARLGSVTKAAAFLKISQPSLSSQLKILESHLERALFIREGRRLTLSEDGRMVHGHCRAMFEAAEDLQAHLKRDEARSRVVFGVSDEIELPFVTELVAGIVRSPRLRKAPQVSMRSSRHQLLLDQLVTGEVDFMVTDRPSQVDAAIELSKVEMPVVIVAKPKLINETGMLGGSVATLVATLKRQQAGFVLPSDRLKLRHETDSFALRHKLQLPIEFEGDGLASVTRATVEGLGFGILPLPYVEGELRQGRLKVLLQGRRLWSHQLRLMTRRGRSPSEMAVALADRLRDLDSAYRQAWR